MARLRYFGLFFGLLLLGAFTAFAQSSDNKNQPNTAAISGHIKASGKAATGVTVVLLPSDDPLSVGPRAKQALAKTVTDGEGSFRLDGLTAGRYRVLPADARFVPPSENGSMFGPGKNVFLGEGEQVEGIDFALTPAGTISGRVTAAGGQPAMRASVSIRPVRTNGYPGMIFDPMTGAFRQPEATDDNGAFRIYGLAPGRYQLTVYIYGQGKAPVEVFYPGVTDTSRAGTISIASGEEVSNADISLAGASETGYQAQGQVVGDNGKPIAHAVVGVYGISEEGLLIQGSRYQTDDTGRFSVKGLSPGKYSIEAIPDGNPYYSSKPYEVNIPGDNTTDIKIETHPAATVSGTVTIEGTDDPNVLDEVSKLRLNVISAARGLPASVRTVNVASDGAFKAEGLASGQLSFSLNPQSGLSGFSIVRTDRDGVTQKDRQKLSDAEQLTGIQIALVHGAGSLQGQVNVQGGALPDGAQVLVRAHLVGSDNSWELWRSGAADARGHYEIDGLVDGQYEVTASYFSQGRGTGDSGRQTVTVTGGQAPDTAIILDLSKTTK
jgi:hypothetical protein